MRTEKQKWYTVWTRNSIMPGRKRIKDPKGRMLRRWLSQRWMNVARLVTYGQGYLHWWSCIIMPYFYCIYSMPVTPLPCLQQIIYLRRHRSRSSGNGIDISERFRKITSFGMLFEIQDGYDFFSRYGFQSFERHGIPVDEVQERRFREVAAVSRDQIQSLRQLLSNVKLMSEWLTLLSVKDCTAAHSWILRQR